MSYFLGLCTNLDKMLIFGLCFVFKVWLNSTTKTPNQIFASSKSKSETQELETVFIIKVNNKDTRTTSMTSFWCLFCLKFTFFSSITLFCEYCWLWERICLLLPNLNKLRIKNEVLLSCQSWIFIKNVFQSLLTFLILKKVVIKWPETPETVVRKSSVKKVFLKIWKIHRKIPVPEPLFK